MKKIKAIISTLIAVPAMMVFAGECSAEMLPMQLAAGMALLGVLAINGAFNRNQI